MKFAAKQIRPVVTSNYHDDSSDRSTLLQSITTVFPESREKAKVQVQEQYPTHKMAEISRPLAYFLLAVNTLLIALGGLTTALAAYILQWAERSRGSNDNTYTLKPEAMSQTATPSSAEIFEFPAEFNLMGTKFVLADGVITLVISLLVSLLVVNYCLRPSQHQPGKPQPRSRLTLLLATTFPSIILTVIVIFIVWGDYYRSTAIVFTNDTVQKNRYTHDAPTPEQWLHKLTTSLLNPNAQTHLDDQHQYARAARILTAPIFALQLTAAVALVVLKRRMATPWIPVRNPARAAVKEVELERGRVRHDSAHVHEGSSLVGVDRSTDPEVMERTYERPGGEHVDSSSPLVSLPALVRVQPQPPVWSYHDRRLGLEG